MIGLYKNHKENRMNILKYFFRLIATFGMFIMFNGAAWAVTSPPAQCGLFGSVLTSYDKIVSGGNNIQVCSETVISYPSSAPTPSLACNASGCGSGSCTRIDPPVDKYTITFPTLPSTFLDITTNTVFSPDKMYSGGTVNQYRVFGDVRVSGNSGRTITFTPGDYYFNTLVFPDNNAKIVVSGSGLVRIFVKDNLVLDKNGYEVNTNGTPDQLFIYVGGNLTLNSNGGGNGGLKAYFYVKAQTTFEGNSNWTLTGGVTSEGPIQINGNNPDFIAYSGGAGGGYGDCIVSAPVSTGLFDGWDTFRSVADRNISTKVAGKNFNLTIGSLNSAKTALELKPSGVKTYYRLYDFTADTNRSAYTLFDANATSSIVGSFNVPSASKEMKVEFKFCADYNGTAYILKADSACNALPICTTLNTICYRETASTDAFAIRPERLDINSTHYDYPNLLRSAQDYNTTIRGLAYNSTTNVQDYNITDANSTYIITTTKYMKNNDINASMGGSATFAVSGFDMVNGLSKKGGVSGEVAGLTFSDVGKINIRLEDRIWSAVDNDDTPQNCDMNGTYVCGDNNVTFIPDHFDFSVLGITNNNGNPGSFTYIANEVNQMAGRIHTQMQALNKLNGITANFASFPLWENNVSVVPVVAKSTYLYPDANESNITNLAIGFLGGAKTIAWDETNTSQDLRFNFQRDVNLSQNSFDVNGSDLNISMTSHYVDGIKVADITGSRLGTVSPATGGSKFVYGRIVPRDVRVFGSNISFIANGWYEVFNTSNIAGTLLPPSRNDNGWFINTLHSDSVSIYDGDSNVTVLITGSNPTNANIVVNSGLEEYIFGNSYALGGYKAHIDTDAWLWYGTGALQYLDPANPGNLNCLTHPCFNINIVPPIGATGSAKSTNESTKNVKSLTSGGGTWRSTTDYAPGIR
jgi:hypothetical protein